MCFVFLKYSDIISVAPDFKDVYDLDSEKKGGWKRYIITNEFIATLENVLSSFTSQKKKSFWIQGTYGTGKSHTLAVFKHLLCDEFDEASDFLKRLTNSQLRNDFIEFRKEKRMFPIVLNGIHGISDSLSLSQVIQTQVKKAIVSSNEGITLNLLTDLEQVIKLVSNDDYSSIVDRLINGKLSAYCDSKEDLIKRLKDDKDFTVFKIIEKQLKEDGLNLTTTSDINSWLLEVNKNVKASGKYDGIVIFWDEFTSILEISESRALLVDIQQIATLAEQGVYLFIVTHKLYNAIEGYKNLIKDDQKKIEDRFSIEKFEIDTLTNYNIMSSAMIRTDEDAVKQLIDRRVLASISVKDAIDKIAGSRSNALEVKNQIINLYPFHPYVAFCSTNLARIVGSAKRSVFQFLNDSKYGFLDFIKNDTETVSFLTIERLWDFFFIKFKDDPKYLMVVNTFLKNEPLITELCDKNDYDMYLKVLKCTLLLNILQDSISSTDEFSERQLSSPTLDNITLAYVGVYTKEQIENVLKIYNEKGIVNLNPRGEYTVVVSSVAPEKVKAETKAIMQNFRDVAQIIKEYPNELKSFKDGLSSSFLRASTIDVLPYSIPEIGLNAYIDKVFSDKKCENNVKLLVFLKRGFNDSSLGFSDELSEEELRAKIIEFASTKKSDVIFLLVKDIELSQRVYNSWVDARSRAKILQQSDNWEEARGFNASADQWISHYISNLKDARFSVVFRNDAVEKKYNDCSKFIQNDIVKSIIYKFGLEKLKLNNTVWKQLNKPKTASISRMLQQTLTEVKGSSRSNSLPSTLVPLITNANGLGDIFNEDMKIVSNDDNHAIIHMINEVDKVIEACKNQTEIDLSDKLEFLFKSPYGFYNCECYNAALALCLRKYINKIRLLSASATIVNESSMCNIVTALFDHFVDEKPSNILRVRFSTEAEIKLMNNLSSVFGVTKNEDSTLTSIKWEVRTSFDTNYKAPLWVLKYFTDKEKLKSLIDKLFKFTVTADENFSETETKELSVLFENNLVDFTNLLQEIKKDDCFRAYLKNNLKNSGKNESFIDKEIAFLKDKMKSENNFKTEKEVEAFIDEFLRAEDRKADEKEREPISDEIDNIDTTEPVIIIPGMEKDEKIKNLISLCKEKQLDDKVIDFIEDFAKNNINLVDKLSAYISAK